MASMTNPDLINWNETKIKCLITRMANDKDNVMETMNIKSTFIKLNYAQLCRLLSSRNSIPFHFALFVLKQF